MTSPQNQLITQARNKFNKMDWAGGIKILEKFLLKENSLEAINLMGVAYAHKGEYSKAEHYFLRCLSSQKNNNELLLQLGKLYRIMGRIDDAMAILTKIISNDPSHQEALINLGQVVYEKGEKTAAIRAFDTALRLNKDSEKALQSLYNALYSCAFYEQAADIAKSASENNKLSTEMRRKFRSELILAYREAEMLEASRSTAESLLNELLTLKDPEKHPLYPIVMNNYAATLMELNEDDLAEEYCKKLLNINNEVPEALINLAKLAERKENIRLATEYYEQAIKAHPSHPILHHHFATFLRSAGLYDQAVKHHYAALSALPDHPEVQFYLGGTLLQMGKLEEGWKYWPMRWSQSTTGHISPFTTPYWPDEQKTKKTNILAYREQGIGDEICFLNCIADLKNDFPLITLQCHQKLKQLIKRSFPDIKVITNLNELSTEEIVEFSHQIAIGTLPCIYRKSLSDFPHTTTLLVSDKEKTAIFRNALDEATPKDNLRVGIAWRSSKLIGGRFTLYPHLDNWGPLFSIPGITWINLQVGDCEHEMLDAERKFGVEIVNFSDIDHFDDLDSSAALMAACDLVIGGDTSSLFLSAAIGVPTLRLTIMQDYFCLGSQHHPWLPAMTVLRRQFGGSWEEPISVAAQITAALSREHQKN